uniref:Rab-GAP TBC domain-containing protein n=1 Tax=Oryza brachyantha TaxID=4533 RepID=J3L6X9_ORYBR
MASSPRSPPEFEISRQSRLLAALSKKVIDLDELRMLAAQGVPDGAAVRPTVWKLLLGYVPNDRALWEQELAKKRSQYAAFKEEFLCNPMEIARRQELEGQGSDSAGNINNGLLHRLEVTKEEHPLSLGKTSAWNQFFEYSEIMEQIDRDVKRTHPDMHFFCGDSSFAKSNQESLKNVLIIFAKLNAGIRYVQ